MLVAIVATVSWAIVTVVLGFPFVRAWARRLERRNEPNVPSDVSARLARIEAAVDSIAIEVERISESQRFLTKLQADRPLSAGSTPPDRQR
jgi:hypothetical protein